MPGTHTNRHADILLSIGLSAHWTMTTTELPLWISSRFAHIPPVLVNLQVSRFVGTSRPSRLDKSFGLPGFLRSPGAPGYQSFPASRFHESPRFSQILPVWLGFPVSRSMETSRLDGSGLVMLLSRLSRLRSPPGNLDTERWRPLSVSTHLFLVLNCFSPGYLGLPVS